MFLKQLTIRRKDAWEDKARPLVGSVWFENNDGAEVKIVITNEAAERIVALCAEGIVEASRQVAATIAQDLEKGP